MAMIQLMGPGPHHDISTLGTLLRVGDITLDCAALQENSEVVIDVFSAGGSLSLHPPGAFAANVRIPARRWVDSAVPSEESDGETVMEATPVELDPNTIEITLWPKA